MRAATRVRKRVGTAMPSGYEAHLRMIADPCNAPLVSPVTGGSEAAVKARLKSVSNVSHTPATNAGTYYYGVAWNPVLGAYNLYANNAGGFQIAGTPCLWSLDVTNYPGNVITQSKRAMGGCVSVAWAETELNRKGMIYSGVINGSVIWTSLRSSNGGEGTTFKPEDLATMLANTCRTPNDRCELTWVPTDIDSEYTDFSVQASSNLAEATLFARSNFVVMLFAASQSVGFTVGLEIKSVAIYEYVSQNYGVVHSSAHAEGSGPPVTLTGLVRILQHRDPLWYIDGFKKLARLVGKGVSAYARGGALGLAAEVAGMTISSRKNFAS